MQTLKVIGHFYQTFFGSSGMGVVFTVALIWLLWEACTSGSSSAMRHPDLQDAETNIRKHSQKERWRSLLWPAVIIAGVTLCPITARALIRAIGQDVYWRVFWMLPVAAVAALLLTEVSERVSPRWRRAAVVAGLGLLIALNGKLILGNSFFTERTNDYKLPQHVLDVADMISAHAAANDIPGKKTVSPEEIAVYLRLYDPSIMQSYGRDALKIQDRQTELFPLINAQEPDYEALISVLRHYKYKYVVLRKSADDRDVMEGRRFEYLGEAKGETDDYVVYFNTSWYKFLEKKKEREAAQAAEGTEVTGDLSESVPSDTAGEDTPQAGQAAEPGAEEAADSGSSAAAAITEAGTDTAPAGEGVLTTQEDAWTVTQYGPRDVNSMFYTIYNPQQGLIVVDGGWREDADYVRSVISSLGGKVDAWILTHPHQDHCGAFNAIWEQDGRPEVEKVYAVEMASPEDCLEVASWDSTECLEDFLALDIPQLTYVHRGDELDLCGLHFTILNAFDDKVRELSRDYLNDGSMMFKVTGPEKTMLFCADVGKSMSAYLYTQYKAILPSDYVQMGHHGNGGLRKRFYKKVKPEAAFFDAPDWLMEDPEGKYNTPAKIELMESLGSRILSFSTAPNEVTL